MSILFSNQCEYALQAVTYLALKKDGTVVSIKFMSKKLSIPYHFLGKILQKLCKHGLLISSKGPHGGFGLAKPAHEITLFQIVDAIDGAAFIHECVMGFAECSDAHQCSVHTTWKEYRDGILGMLQDKSIAQIAKAMKKPGYKT